jgi:hypothetical protein
MPRRDESTKTAKLSGGRAALNRDLDQQCIAGKYKLKPETERPVRFNITKQPLCE